ncbi:MAG: hypothetical protein H7Z37_14555 [Pyrinomonadaceae bacterium]|nr:hypothetical protein [Pyrinomonadaceae bacterium]
MSTGVSVKSSTPKAELALWLSATQCFLQPENQIVTDGTAKQHLSRNWIGEVRVVQWGLLRCSQHSNQLKFADENEMNALAALSDILLEATIISDTLCSGKNVSLMAWTNWREWLNDSIAPSATAFINSYAPEIAATSPLDSLRHQVEAQGIIGADVQSIIADLMSLLDRLRFVEILLENDQPLKSTLLLFSLIHSETQRLLTKVNCASQLVEQGTPLFDALDGIAYIAPMELRKVFAHELLGLSELRQAPAIFAKVETAFGLLQDCFQQSIVALAKIHDEQLSGELIFSNYKTKLDQSLKLRNDLWVMLKNIQHTEQKIEHQHLANLRKIVADFKESSMRFLMYKDCETTERFIEEILYTRQPKEVAQVLHRFSAYLETLLGQVNMRTVLATHPFDYPKIEV